LKIDYNDPVPKSNKILPKIRSNEKLIFPKDLKKIQFDEDGFPIPLNDINKNELIEINSLTKKH